MSSEAAQRRQPPRYLDVVDRVWPALRRFMGAHTALYKASGGRLGHSSRVVLLGLLRFLRFFGNSYRQSAFSHRRLQLSRFLFSFARFDLPEGRLFCGLWFLGSKK